MPGVIAELERRDIVENVSCPKQDARGRMMSNFPPEQQMSNAGNKQAKAKCGQHSDRSACHLVKSV